MSDYPFGSVEDHEMLAQMSKKELLDLLFLHVRNLWRVDGLYFLGIEKKYGTDAAAEIDAGVWATMACIEAKSLARMFRVGENPDAATVVGLLQKSSWALDQPFKTIKISKNRVTLSVVRCRTQETRIDKGLCEFPCKGVRFGYLRAFAETLNPRMKVNCVICPPGGHPKNLWCQWEFTF